MTRMSERYPISQIGRLRMGTDGKGIRSLILLQQCPLRCKYCINPFTWDGSQRPKMMSAKEIYDTILIDRPYMLATSGGVTFGGGEPLLHSQLIGEFSKCNKDGFSIYVETSLNVPRENLDQVIDLVDMYYVDIKSADPATYEQYTGGDIIRVLDNLEYLLSKVGSSRIVVRIPTIPGYADMVSQRRSKEYLASLGVKYFDLFDYKIV